MNPMDQLPERDLQHILLHTRDLWEELRGRRVFVTGGTGLFGKWLVAAFCHANDTLSLDARLVILTRNPDRARSESPRHYGHPRVTLHAGNVQSFQFPEGEFSHIIHAATENDPFTTPIARDQLFDANVAGTRRVLEFAANAGVRRLLNVSSGAVYGPQSLDVLHIAEDSAVAPDTARVDLAYGHSKRTSEFLVSAHAGKYDYDACSARCFAFVGAHLPLDANFAIGNFIGDALKGGPIHVNSDGTTLRSYLYMADLAIWLWTLLLRGASARAYNVGADQAISVGSLAQLVADIVNPSAEVIIAQTPTPGKPAARYVPSIARARSELGLEAWVDLTEAIERTAAWYRSAAK
jgi:nucleoside-diphosphate-sugar epimerase